MRSILLNCILLIIFVFTSKINSQEQYDLIGKLDTGPTCTIDMEGSLIYFNKGGHSIQLMQLDSSNKFADVGEYTINKMGSIKQICAINKFVYVAMEYEGLVIIDFTDPLSPKLIGNYKPQKPYLPSMVNYIEKKDHYIFINNDDELHILDVENPYEYKVTAIYRNHGTPIKGIKLFNGYLYLLGGGYELLNISSPASPTSLYFETTTFDDIAFSGNKLFMVRGYDGLTIYDITNPLSPSELKNYNIDSNRTYYMNKISIIENNHAFITYSSQYTGGGLYLFDIANLNNITNKGIFSYQVLDFIEYDNSFISYGGLLTGFEPIKMYNKKDLYETKEPNSFVPISTFYSRANASSFCLEGDYVYLSDYTSGYLRIIDVKDLTHPFEINYFKCTRDMNFYSLQYVNNTVFALDDKSIKSIDVSINKNPIVLDSLELSLFSMKLYLSGTLLFSVGDYGFEIIDIKDPHNMKKLGTFNHADTKNIFVKGNYVYLADGGVRVIDISDPELPTEVSQPDISGWIYSFDIIGDKLYCCSEFQKLFIVDISNPLSISLVKEIDYDYEPGYWIEIKIYEQDAFVRSNNGELSVFSLADPLAPQKITDIELENLRGIAFNQSGIFCLGEELTILNNDSSINDVATDELIPNDFSLQQNYPNPFNPKTNIRFEIPRRSNVILSVFTINGEKVTDLVNGELTSGSYEYEFDGSALSSGIYFYQLKAENYIQTKKLVLLK